MLLLVSPSPPDDPLSTDSSDLSTNGEKSSANGALSTNKSKKTKEKKEDPEVIKKWKEQQVSKYFHRPFKDIFPLDFEITLYQILFNVLHFIIIFFKLKSLEQKDEAEEEAKLVLRAQAKQELDDWYKQHAEQVKE